MKKVLALAALVLVLAGCSSPGDKAEEAAHVQEQMWEASHDGPMPPHSAADIRDTIESITHRSNHVMIDGSTDADCAAYSDAFDVLSLANFTDERKDYIDPIMNDASQVVSGCETRGTWEGTIDNVIDISKLGEEYLARF